MEYVSKINIFGLEYCFEIPLNSFYKDGETQLRKSSTYSTKIGGPPLKIIKLHFKRWPTPGNHQVIVKR